jgi:prevent-host-death family protein
LTIVNGHDNFWHVTHPPETVSISEFKATCLARLERVRRTGQRLLITKHGQPIAEVIPPSPAIHPDSWLGTAADTGRIMGDLVEPVVAPPEWEAAR